jgi:hypothetical protein
MKITCSLAGAQFRPAEAKEALRTAIIGTMLELEPDPENEYDPRAVQVLLDGLHVGFIPRQSNGPIFDRLADGDSLYAEIIAFTSPLSPILEIEL